MQRILLLALACALLCACAAPQRAPRTGRTYSVAILRGDDWTDWSPWARLAAERALVPLHETGDRWVLARSELDADVLVRTFDSGARRQRDLAAGYYELGTRTLWVDPGALRGDAEVQWVVVHEALHWLLWTRASWAGHVCRRPDEAPDCSALVRGESVLAPSLARDDDGAPLDPRLYPADRALLHQLGL